MNVKGYKVFNPDWTCRGFKYEVGKTYEENIKPKLCERGFHFCEKAIDCFNYYFFNPDNKVVEVLALGDVVTEGNKSCTNKIQIVREISWTEVLEIVNTGRDCTGLGNTGNYNSGNYNSGNYNSGNCNNGDCNSGDWNSGYRNSGNWNSGNGNSGNFNSGDYNNGNCNSGYRNNGSYNSGDWNETSFSNGCFNTIKQKIYLFNRLSKWTYEDWRNSKTRRLLKLIPIKTDNSNNVMEWWHSLSNDDRNIILSIPNFDKEIFKKITGIDVDE